ncbi:hypothetical protein [uncultured Mediterranean phage uvMED]|nr:hypothetical protein [uncultured Mediterranean phage uvMED]BAR22559.1 hypothetical protein [uncultured Mediterranean phage uvMED]
MRGSSNNNNGNFKYINFISGKFVERVPEGTQGAEARKLTKGPNEGKEIFELKHDNYAGQIFDIRVESTEYGQKLVMLMDIANEGEPETTAKISLSMSSGPAKGFCAKMENIDFSKDVELRGYYIERSDKPGVFGSYMVPYQGGAKIAPLYTRDNPNGLPEMEKIKVKGVEMWDDTKQIEFYSKIVDRLFGTDGEANTDAGEDLNDEPAF